jgi:hypothetical protein
MKKTLPLFFTSAAACFATISPLSALVTPTEEVLQAKNSPKGPTLKLLVLDDVEGALVEVKGAYNVYDPRANKKLTSAFSASSYFMQPTTDGIKWGIEFPGVFQVTIVPDSPHSSILVHGIEYKGMITAYQIDGAISFVNELSIDDYAASIVSERCQGKPLAKEALAALLIAARTDALNASQHGKTKYWDVKAEEVGYQGAAVCRQDKPFLEAMEQTSHMVINSSQPVAWLHGSIPLEEIQKQAEAGKDARAILAGYTKCDAIVLANN